MKTHSPITSKRGILVGRPLAGAMLLAWLLALAGFIQILRQNQQLVHEVESQQGELLAQKEQIKALQERLRILEAVEDMQSNLSPDEEVHLANEVYHDSRLHSIDPLLVLALIRVESGFSPGAVSSMGALGLMQVMPATARIVSERRGWNWPGEGRLLEPGFNIRLATDYLAELISKFGSVETALIAYNCGEGVVETLGKAGEALPREYCSRVLLAYHFLQNHYGEHAPPLEPLAAPLP